MAEFLRQYKPTYFSIKELVSKALYQERKDRALSLLNAHILYSADTLRAYLTDLTPATPNHGQLSCNTWAYGGHRQFSGLRVPGDSYYKHTSQHAQGDALDLISSYYSADFLRSVIMENRDLFPYVTCIEMDVNWLHMDCRNLPANAPEGALMLVYPDGTYRYV